jgi:endonuclease/exonuclease/phosphatase family metal-dependent hydrolase
MEGVLRLLSWNLAYGKPAAYKSIQNRQRQWALIGALAPDIVLLQECRPDDINKHAPPWMADSYEVVGHLQPGWRLRSSLLVRKPLHVAELDRRLLGAEEARLLGTLPGSVAAGTVRGPGFEFVVASIHALAMEVDSLDVSDSDHDRLRRSSLDRAWYNDLIVGALEPLAVDRPFLIGGDWNNSPLFDENYPRRWGSIGPSTEFFDRRRARGWFDAMRKFHESDVRTYLDDKSAPYELDRVFTDRETHDRTECCFVIDDPALTELSDHAPLIVEVRIS